MNRSVLRVTGTAAGVAAALLLLAQCDLAGKVREPGISRLDAFVANNIGPNQVYLNDGHGEFTVHDLETAAQGAYSYGVALGEPERGRTPGRLRGQRVGDME